ncbi:MAG TPA: DUF6247 family protein, partial [Pseudonocardiaceae bacterium]
VSASAAISVRHDASSRSQQFGVATAATARRYTPRGARSPPEFRAQFDQDYRTALEEAGRTLDLSGVHDTVEHWRMRSWITRDPQEHRRVVRRAAELLGQTPPADEPVAITESRL